MSTVRTKPSISRTVSEWREKGKYKDLQNASQAELRRIIEVFARREQEASEILTLQREKAELVDRLEEVSIMNTRLKKANRLSLISFLLGVIVFFLAGFFISSLPIKVVSLSKIIGESAYRGIFFIGLFAVPSMIYLKIVGVIGAWRYNQEQKRMAYGGDELTQLIFKYFIPLEKNQGGKPLKLSFMAEYIKKKHPRFKNVELNVFGRKLTAVGWQPTFTKEYGRVRFGKKK